MKAPQTAYEFEKNDSHGNEMVLRFDGSVTISEAQVYLGGKEKRHFVCSVPNAEGDGWDAIGEETELLSVYCWNPVEIHYRTYELGIVSMDEIIQRHLMSKNCFRRIQPMNTKVCLMRFTMPERQMR